MRPEAFALAAFLAASQAQAQVRFDPVEVPLHVYSGGWEHFVGGGLAVLDCDADGLPDLYAAGGASPAQLLRNISDVGGALQFEARTPAELALTGVTGAYPLDIDGDGLLDLAVLRVGPNLLLRGAPDCGFAGFDNLDLVAADRWTTAFSATWEGINQLPTLAFGNYVDRTDPEGPFGACDVNLLYRPDGLHYPAPLPLVPGFCPLSMLFSDWGRTGRADLRISNDRHYYVNDGAEQMWAMESRPRLYDQTDGWRQHRLWGMGIASRDLDGDGRPEVMMSSMGDQRLQKLDADATGPAFRDVPFETGATAHRPYAGSDGRPSTGWHVAFGDVQNDGRDDIFIAKGNVEQMPDAAMDDPNNLLIQGPDRRFTEAGDSAGIASLHRARGAALTDLNADGLLDLAVVNRRAPLEIYRNVTADPDGWLQIALSQDGPNRNAVGAWIEVETAPETVQAREITVGGGHAGGSAGPEHFGLGDAPEARIRVIWPDGAVSDWAAVAARSRLTVARAGNRLAITPY